MNTSSQLVRNLAHLARPRPTLIVGIFLAAILIALATHETRPTKPVVQVEFEDWFSDFEQKQKNGLNLQEIPNISLIIQPLDGASEAREFRVAGTASNEDGEHVVRLLQIIRESELLANASSKPGTGSGEVSLRIDGPQKSFSFKIPQDSLSSNIKAGLFLKLFEEFSKSKTASAQPGQDATKPRELTPDEMSSLPQEIQDAIENSTNMESK